MKRKPSTSAESAVKAMVDAALGLPDLPAHAFLRPQDRPFWDGIVRARARDEWTEADLVVACQLARCQADIESESMRLDAEGSVLRTDKGTPVANPLHSVLDMLCRREMAIFRTLRMGGAAAGEARHVVARRSVERSAAQVREELAEEDDGLLAR